MASEVIAYKFSEIEKDLDKLEGVPKDIALVLVAIDSLEGRFRNLQRAFYFFGSCFVTGAAALYFKGLDNTPTAGQAARAALSALGLS